MLDAVVLMTARFVGEVGGVVSDPGGGGGGQAFVAIAADVQAEWFPAAS